MKFEPTSRAGIFLGYPIHPDFLWRHEFLVIPLRDLMEKDYDQPIAPLRVNQIKCPDGEFSFPMVERHLLHMNGVMPGLDYAPETPDPAALDAPLLEEDLPAEMPGQDDIDDQELAENLGKLIKDSPEKGPASEEMVKVIDLKTSKDTFVPKDGGAHYDAGGVKARRYSGSSKPDSILFFGKQCQQNSGDSPSSKTNERRLARLCSMSPSPRTRKLLPPKLGRRPLQDWKMNFRTFLLCLLHLALGTILKRRPLRTRWMLLFCLHFLRIPKSVNIVAKFFKLIFTP